MNSEEVLLRPEVTADDVHFRFYNLDVSCFLPTDAAINPDGLSTGRKTWRQGHKTFFFNAKAPR
jgi:hypothetical protein